MNVIAKMKIKKILILSAISQGGRRNEMSRRDETTLHSICDKIFNII